MELHCSQQRQPHRPRSRLSRRTCARLSPCDATLAECLREAAGSGKMTSAVPPNSTKSSDTVSPLLRMSTSACVGRWAGEGGGSKALE